MTFLVYKIARGDRAVYFGITTGSLAKRWREHKCAAKTGNENVLYRAMRKYGNDAFSITLVYEATSQVEMFAVEKGLIAQYGTFVGAGGYNLTSGGEGCFGNKNLPKGEDNHNAVMREEVIAFIRDPGKSGQCNRELRDEVECRFGVLVTRDSLRDARRGDSWKYLNAIYPPIKCRQGARTSELKRKTSSEIINRPNVRRASAAATVIRMRTSRIAAKLTEEQVRSIYLDRRPNRVIERDYGMSHGIARQIKSRKTWASITGDL